jgi:AmiR/NasT family two-component response regulator
MLLYGADQVAHLQRAVDSRDLIGQAKGILMERFKADDEAAFRMLVRSSQETNMKLTAVAEWLTHGTRAQPEQSSRRDRL